MSQFVGGYRTYSTKAAAVAAIRKLGLHNVPHEIRVGTSGRFLPVFTPELEEDRNYIRTKGVMALAPKAKP